MRNHGGDHGGGADGKRKRILRRAAVIGICIQRCRAFKRASVALGGHCEPRCDGRGAMKGHIEAVHVAVRQPRVFMDPH